MTLPVETLRNLYLLKASQGLSWESGGCRPHNISPDDRHRPQGQIEYLLMHVYSPQELLELLLDSAKFLKLLLGRQAVRDLELDHPHNLDSSCRLRSTLVIISAPPATDVASLPHRRSRRGRQLRDGVAQLRPL